MRKRWTRFAAPDDAPLKTTIAADVHGLAQVPRCGWRRTHADGCRERRGGHTRLTPEAGNRPPGRTGSAPPVRPPASEGRRRGRHRESEEGRDLAGERQQAEIASRLARRNEPREERARRRLEGPASAPWRGRGRERPSRVLPKSPSPGAGGAVGTAKSTCSRPSDSTPMQTTMKSAMAPPITGLAPSRSSRRPPTRRARRAGDGEQDTEDAEFPGLPAEHSGTVDAAEREEATRAS